MSVRTNPAAHHRTPDDDGELGQQRANLARQQSLGAATPSSRGHFLARLEDRVRAAAAGYALRRCWPSARNSTRRRLRRHRASCVISGRSRQGVDQSRSSARISPPGGRVQTAGGLASRTSRSAATRGRGRHGGACWRRSPPDSSAGRRCVRRSPRPTFSRSARRGHRCRRFAGEPLQRQPPMSRPP